MEWQVILVLVLAMPVLLFPVAFVWYLNIGGMYALIKSRREKKATQEEMTGALADNHQTQTCNCHT